MVFKEKDLMLFYSLKIAIAMGYKLLKLERDFQGII